MIDPVPIAASYARQSGRGPAERAEPSPDQAYHHTYQQIEAMGVPLSDARLAVAFSRADMVATPDYDVAGWARRELGLGNLIISARQNFNQAGFFSTAAIAVPDTAAKAPGTVVHESIAKPLRWVLADSGLTLPEGTLTLPGGDDDRSG